MKSLKINKDKPIIPQLEKFKKGKNVNFTALDLLRDSDDIKKFFTEMTEIMRKEETDHPDPREIVRSNLMYISLYGDELKASMKIFSKVLKEEFDECIKNVTDYNKKKLEAKLALLPS